jgi:hypothetical protein
VEFVKKNGNLGKYEPHVWLYFHILFEKNIFWHGTLSIIGLVVKKKHTNPNQQ